MDVWGWCSLLTKHALSLMTAMITDLNLGAAILSHSSMVWAGGAISCPTCWRIEIHLACTNLYLQVFSIQISLFVMIGMEERTRWYVLLLQHGLYFFLTPNQLDSALALEIVILCLANTLKQFCALWSFLQDNMQVWFVLQPVVLSGFSVCFNCFRGIFHLLTK